MRWACKEVCGHRLADPRLGSRLVHMVEGFVERSKATCTGALGLAGARAAYRFWDNPRVERAAVLAAHVGRKAERSSQYAVVLVFQDTSEISLTHHPAGKGLGICLRATAGGCYCTGCWPLHRVAATCNEADAESRASIGHEDRRKWRGELDIGAGQDGKDKTPQAVRACGVYGYGKRAPNAPHRTRTCNLRFRRPMLYPIELGVLKMLQQNYKVMYSRRVK